MAPQRGDGEISFLEKLGLIVAGLKASVDIFFCLLVSPWSSTYKWRTWRRVISDAATRSLSATVNYRQFQWAVGPTVDSYKKWMRKNKLEPVIEDVGEGAKLLWVGSKHADKVIYYLHGGGFVIPLDVTALDLLQYVRGQLAKRGSEDVSIVVLNYSLVPNVPFPGQLRQANAGLIHLLKSGVNPANLQLIGDSAGANLILQLVSHVLHPYPSLPPPPALSAPIRGACLLSPYVNISANGPLFVENGKLDILSKEFYEYLGEPLLKDIPADRRVYAEPVVAGADWWVGSDKVVQRFLVTSGEKECLVSDIAIFVEQLKKNHLEVQVVVQKNAVHNEPLLDFAAGEPIDKKGTLTPVIVEWFAEGFQD